MIESNIKAIEAYKRQYGRYPEKIQLSKEFGLNLQDAWGREINYEVLCNGRGYKIFSNGRNGTDESGEGDDLLKKYDQPCL